VVCAILLGFAGCPAYRHYRERLALRNARKFATAGDYRNAALSARRLLLLNPANIDGCRILAQLAEISNPREALQWYERVATLEPTIENRFELAAKALRFEEPPYELAARTLKEVGASATGRVSYFVLSAELALKLGKPAEAETWLEAAHQLQPSNELHQLNLAVLRLNSTNEAVANQARANLYGLRATKDLSALALRSLIAEAMVRRDWPSAQGFSSELLSNSGALLEDRLQRLDILVGTDSLELKQSLEALQQAASTNAAEMSAISGWMIQHGRAKEASSWLTNVPPIMWREPSMRLATVECLFALSDWIGAETFLKRQNWGELEAMRLGFLSQSVWKRNDRLASDLHWRMALRQAQRKLGSLMWLATKAGEWGRESAREETLWQIAREFPKERWAARQLAGIAHDKGRTRDLHRLYSWMADADPKNAVARNNFAATSLLLQIDLGKAHEMAGELFAQHPTEAIIASTYAYSLHLQKRTTEALEVLEELPEPALTNAAVALYYGVLLRADGQLERARTYLSLARSDTLLPEERQLLEDGLKGL